jgi:hypothetical protein
VAYGYPEVYGVQRDHHCGHCNGRPDHSAYSSYGRFCMACFRWCYYFGPKAQWGDGMRVTQVHVWPMIWT